MRNYQTFLERNRNEIPKLAPVQREKTLDLLQDSAILLVALFLPSFDLAILKKGASGTEIGSGTVIFEMSVQKTYLVTVPDQAASAALIQRRFPLSAGMAGQFATLLGVLRLDLVVQGQEARHATSN